MGVGGKGKGMATSMLEKHRVTLRARYYRAFARDPFFAGSGSTKLPERERNRRKELLSTLASDIKREIYARANSQLSFPRPSPLPSVLRKTLFSTDGKGVSRFDRPEIPRLVAGTSASINPRSMGYDAKRRVQLPRVIRSAACYEILGPFVV